MKKILFASTALVATAGVAAAEISFSGEAGMGFTYVEGRTEVVITQVADPVTGVVSDVETIVPADEWQALSYATLSVAMTGETDGGLSFGADFDITAGAGVGEAVVYIEGGFGKVSMGDIDNAVDAVVGGLSDVGFDGNAADDLGEFLKGVSGADILYEGTFADFTVAASAQINGGDWAIAAGYDMGDYSFGVGVEEFTGTTIYALSAGASVGDVAFNALYAAVDGGGAESYGIDASYTMGAATVTAVYSALTVAGATADTIGLGVSYDLGGGAAVAAGIAQHSAGGVSVNTADFGITMEF